MQRTNSKAKETTMKCAMTTTEIKPLVITKEMRRIESRNQKEWEEAEKWNKTIGARTHTWREPDYETITTLHVEKATNNDKAILRDVLDPGLIMTTSSLWAGKNLEFEIVSLETLEAAHKLTQTRTFTVTDPEWWGYGNPKTQLSKGCKLRLDLPDTPVKEYVRKIGSKSVTVSGYQRRKAKHDFNGCLSKTNQLRREGINQ